ncbi:MAG: DUF4469 domain-containing protein [Spirochaetaceae bacterium]|jgi:hypothetical protein|nr:DUF4469 domain-containing protein [Spirochaetaceae bacterium]
MSVIDDVTQVLHRIRVKLYPSNLPERKGELIARTVNEKTLTFEEVCVAAKERGGYTGSLDDLKEHIAIFLREAARQLCDGFGVNFGGLFTVYPNVGGVFENERDPVDKSKHKVTFRFRVLNGLRKLAELIEVISEGLAETAGYITEIIDVTTGQVNDIVTKGGIFTLRGDKIKIVGAGNKVGVFFYSLGSPNVSIAVTGNLAVNDPSRIVGTAPELLAGKDWYVEVRTYYSGNAANPLKEMRTIRSTFTVKQAS